MCSALERPDPIPLPATQDSRNQTTLIPEERRFPNVAEHKAMTNIKNGVPTIKAGLSLVRRKPVARGSAVRGRTDALPGGTTIDGMAVSIVPAELEALAQPLSKRKLQAVINRARCVLPNSQTSIIGIQCPPGG